MAAESPRLVAKRRVEYFEIAARTYFTPCASNRVPFRWTVNPYRGCEFGCKYCYARYAHEFMELRGPLDFERKIFVKQFDAGRFRRELLKLPLGESVALGTATDPYQPAERRYQITRAMLEVLAGAAGLRLAITTKSDLVTRDIDLFKEISRRHYFSVSMTVTTADEALARAMEPLAPRPLLRLAAVEKLSRAGLRASVLCAPILPLLNDSEKNLGALARSAAAAGALSFGGSLLFLKDCSRDVFLSFLEERFPLLARRYGERFKRGAFLRGAYPARIRQRLAAIRRLYGFDRAAPPPQPELWPSPQPLETQLRLF